MSLIARGQLQDLRNAKQIADTLVYALAHDNQGDPLPTSRDASGLHNGMFAGDISLFNTQGTQRGQPGQVRLAGFTAMAACPQTGFCLLLDGATGGNNAFGILAQIAANRQFHSSAYLNAAVTIGNWIYGNLLDTSGTGYGGYFAGYPDQGLPKTLLTGKSTENNADIYAAFIAIADAEKAVGNASEASLWTTRANFAGDFVMQMYAGNGRFYAGTVPLTQGPAPGIYPDGPRSGSDVVNTFDFLDAETFATLALAPSERYRSQIDWHLPVQWVLDHFQQSIAAADMTFRGFDLIEPSEHLSTDGPPGIAWEFTAQEVTAMELVDTLYGTSQFRMPAATYLDQIRLAQTAAPFSDGQGIVASTLQGGDTVSPYQQCLVTPFQCIAERTGLAATIWAIAAEQGIDLLQSQWGNATHFAIADSGGISLATSGTAATTQPGYAVVQPDAGRATPGGLAILGFRENGVLTTETGVPATPLILAGRIYAEAGGPVNTGLAIANPNSQDATLIFSFTDKNGIDFAQGSATIPAYGQIARFFD